MSWYDQFCQDWLAHINPGHEIFDGRPLRDIREFWERFLSPAARSGKALQHFANLRPTNYRTQFLAEICRIAWNQNITARTPDPLVWRRKLAREMTPRMVASFARVAKILEQAELLFAVPAIMLQATGVRYELGGGEPLTERVTVVGGVELPPHTVSRGLSAVCSVLETAKKTRRIRLGKFVHCDSNRSTIADARSLAALARFADVVEEYTGRPLFTPPGAGQGKKQGLPHAYRIRDIVRGVGYPITWHDRDVRLKLREARKRISAPDGEWAVG